MLKKRLLAFSMSFMMFASIGLNINPGGVAFANATEEQNSNEEMKAELEKVVKLVKSRITIPEKYTQFTYDFDTDYLLGTTYELEWRNQDYDGWVRVQADKAGNILSYRIDSKSEEQPKLTFLKSELEDTAKKEAEKLNPATKGKLKISNSYYSKYQNCYIYVFDRVEQGIPMNNQIEIAINSDSKQVASYYCDWLFDATVPSKDVKISEAEAKNIIKKQVKLELKYLTDYEWKDDKLIKNVYLAYVPDKSYVSVDAKTGKVYLSNDKWNYINSEESMKTAAADSTADNGTGMSRGSEVPLTEEEIKALNNLDGLISKEQAIKKITSNKYLFLDSNAVAITTNLVKYDDKYYWRVEFEDPRPIDYSNETYYYDYYRARANASIDAKTGEIISYYASVNDNYSIEQLLKQPSLVTKKACRNTFEAFVKSQNTERLANSKLTQKNDEYTIYENGKDSIYGGFGLRYDRVNEGIIYSENRIYGGVDRLSGKIYNYSYYWDDDITFESPKKAMSADKAIDYYLNLPGYGLVYEENYIHTYDEAYQNKDEYYDTKDAYSVEREIRLVYSTSDIGYCIISPFTGKEMNHNNENSERNQFTNYTDIAGHPYERYIRLLSDIGLGYNTEKFSPDALITNEEMIEFMKIVGLSLQSKYDDNDKTNKGELTDYRVTRQQACEYIISCMQMNVIADMNGIFTTGYSDETSISKDAIGSVALCKGLGLLTFVKDNTFAPTEKLTKGQAAKMAIDLFLCELNNYYYYY